MTTKGSLLAAGLVALLGFGWAAVTRANPDGADPVSPATPSTKEATRIPPIDAKAPKTTKTATFALG